MSPLHHDRPWIGPTVDDIVTGRREIPQAVVPDLKETSLEA
ncbi:hypothetical protein [Streptomyces sp. NPDC059247]